MCLRLPSALSNTHVTLSATVVLPSTGTGTGSIVISTPTGGPSSGSATTTRRSSSTSSSLTVPSSTQTSTSRPTTLRTTTMSSSSSSTGSLATSTTTLAQSTTTDSKAVETSQSASSPTLGTSQVVGITAGVVGGVILLTLAAIFLARRARNKNYSDPYDESFSGDVKKGGSPEPKRPPIFHISSPMFRFSRPPQAAQPPPMPSYPGNDERDPTIGIAISRPRSEMYRPRSEIAPRPQEALLERKPSKLLPAKPTLTLAIPPQTTTTTTTTANAPSSQPPPTTDRASTMTNMTAFADLDTEAAEGGQIWRPPPTDPQSATTYYVADKWGNWVLGNDNRKSQVTQLTGVAELDTYTPLTKSPIERREEEAAAMAGAISVTTNFPKKPKPAFLSIDPNDPSISRSSSLYSQASAVRPRPPLPPARRSSSSSRKGAKVGGGGGGGGVRRSDSQASVTTINTESSGDDDEGTIIENENDIARLSQLSPVAESPSPIRAVAGGGGGSRPGVRYPKIPGRLDGATIRLVPPPKRPNFSSSPPGQPSPTLGMVLPVATGSPSAYPPPLRPKRPYRGPAPVQSSGSGFSPIPTLEPDFSQQQQQQIQGLPQRPQLRLQQQQQPTTRLPRTITPPQQQEQEQQQWQEQQQAQSQPQSQPQPPPRLDTQITGRGSSSQSHIASQFIASPMSTATSNSAASSLLAKRIGSDKAAALALDPNNPNGRRRAAPWRRQDGGAGGFLLSPDIIAGFGSPPQTGGTLPMTPTWQPKLTPTRRGDDLFLSVQ